LLKEQTEGAAVRELGSKEDERLALWSGIIDMPTGSSNVR